ncbi:MAG TPA: BPSS1780 family membrane protein [Ramlibacter sp.]|nr:BPSS1780 family membrane protein [Ramlibacter sp.]
MKLNIVPAATGITWVKLGLRTFLKQPLALAALVFMYATFAITVLIVPLAGPFLVSAFVPIATLGLMAATRVAETSEFPLPTVLFTAFRASRDRIAAMLVLGAIYAVAVYAIASLVALLVPVPVDGKTPAEIFQTDEFGINVILSAVFYVPVSLAFWHAPALVHWHGVPPVKSLFFSFVACVRNARAFLVYALAWMGIVIAIVIASALAAAVSPWLSGVVFGATSTIATIAFYISIYFTFRDSFLEDEDPPGETP